MKSIIPKLKKGAVVALSVISLHFIFIRESELIIETVQALLAK